MNTRRIGAVPKESLWVGLKGGILDKKHTRTMGSSIWLFAYLTMRQTQLNENGEGLPRYGNPTSTIDISDDTGWSRDQIEHWMRKLVATGYVRTERRGNDGVVVFIKKAKKKQKVTCTGSAKTAESNAQLPPDRRSKYAQFRESQGTHDDNQSQSQTVARFPTKSLSYSETSTYSNTDAAAKNAAGDFLSFTGKESARPKTLPRDKSHAELDERRRFLLRQSEELARKYPAKGNGERQATA